MTTLRISPSVWDAVETHLRTGAHEERFAFLLCQRTRSRDRHVLMATECILVPRNRVVAGADGWMVDDPVVDDVLNKAIRTEAVLIEIHNHGGDSPGFSQLDRAGIDGFARYALETVPAAAYGAAVWAGGRIVGEVHTLNGGDTIVIEDLERVTAAGRTLRLLTPAAHPEARTPRVARQVPWMTTDGQRDLESLRFGVVGASGNGTQIIQGLAMLGAIDYVVVDDDVIEEPNGNRLVTSIPAEIGMSKVMSACRWIRTHHPEARVYPVHDVVESVEAIDVLRGVDFVLSCVDNDGARLVINRLALAYGIPMIDIATGINVGVEGVEAAGGRVAIVRPDGPCLSCTDELDGREVSYYFAGDEQRSLLRAQGYAPWLDEPAPAVATLNGVASNVALNELTVWLSGLRTHVDRIDIDVIDSSGRVGPWVAPRSDVQRREGCVECSYRWRGDDAIVDLMKRPRQSAGNS